VSEFFFFGQVRDFVPFLVFGQKVFAEDDIDITRRYLLSGKCILEKLIF
jgi:hypothetical protein